MHASKHVHLPFHLESIWQAIYYSEQKKTKKN